MYRNTNHLGYAFEFLETHRFYNEQLQIWYDRHDQILEWIEIIHEDAWQYYDDDFEHAYKIYALWNGILRTMCETLEINHAASAA